MEMFYEFHQRGRRNRELNMTSISLNPKDSQCGRTTPLKINQFSVVWLQASFYGSGKSI